MIFYKSEGFLLVFSGNTHCECHSWEQVERGTGNKRRGDGGVRDRGVGKHGGMSGGFS